MEPSIPSFFLPPTTDEFRFAFLCSDSLAPTYLFPKPHPLVESHLPFRHQASVLCDLIPTTSFSLLCFLRRGSPTQMPMIKSNPSTCCISVHPFNTSSDSGHLCSMCCDLHIDSSWFPIAVLGYVYFVCCMGISNGMKPEEVVPFPGDSCSCAMEVVLSSLFIFIFIQPPFIHVGFMVAVFCTSHPAIGLTASTTWVITWQAHWWRRWMCYLRMCLLVSSIITCSGHLFPFCCLGIWTVWS